MGFVLFAKLIFYFGLHWTAVLSGGLNFAIALFVSFRPQCPPWGRWACLLSIPILCLYCFQLDDMMERGEQELYRHKIVWKEQSPYQKIVVVDQGKKGGPHYEQTQWEKFNSKFKPIGQSPDGKLKLKSKTPTGLKSTNNSQDEICLFINGGLQFNSRDEHIYHEHLIHPIIEALPEKKHILVMGAGDGLALRELLKHEDIKSIDLVELDPVMTNFASTHPALVKLNQNSLLHPKVNIIHRDAWAWARKQSGIYDAIILDFPDPHHIETAKLYSLQFYKLLKFNLKGHGLIITQATSPLIDQRAFACIRKTLESAQFKVDSLHVTMRSFGQWGFHIARQQGPSIPHRLCHWKAPHFVKSFDQASLLAAFIWPPGFEELVRAQPVNDFLSLPLFQLYEHR
jgi:spermidine synthase